MLLLYYYYFLFQLFAPALHTMLVAATDSNLLYKIVFLNANSNSTLNFVFETFLSQFHTIRAVFREQNELFLI